MIVLTSAVGQIAAWKTAPSLVWSPPRSGPGLLDEDAIDRRLLGRFRVSPFSA